MGRGVRVRPARTADIPAIARLWREMMDLHNEFDPRFAIVRNSEDISRRYLHSVMERSDYRIFVAVDEDRVVGYTMGIILANPEMFQLSQYGFLAEMSVHQDYRLQGLGRQMWESLEEWFAGVGVEVVQLNVSVLNAKGRGFWDKLGFEPFLEVLWKKL